MVHFNPRFPWGKRLEAKAQTISLIVFQSTLPVGEATLEALIGQPYTKISIHASRGGSDLFLRLLGEKFYFDFNPRFPWGKRPIETATAKSHIFNFNPRFPWGKRLLFSPSKILRGIFQSTLPVGEATAFFVARI